MLVFPRTGAAGRPTEPRLPPSLRSGQPVGARRDYKVFGVPCSSERVFGLAQMCDRRCRLRARTSLEPHPRCRLPRSRRRSSSCRSAHRSRLGRWTGLGMLGLVDGIEMRRGSDDRHANRCAIATGVLFGLRCCSGSISWSRSGSRFALLWGLPEPRRRRLVVARRRRCRCTSSTSRPPGRATCGRGWCSTPSSTSAAGGLPIPPPWAPSRRVPAEGRPPKRRGRSPTSRTRTSSPCGSSCCSRVVGLPRLARSGARARRPHGAGRSLLVVAVFCAACSRKPCSAPTPHTSPG